MPILGTRPEAVKMAPVITRLKAQPELFDCKVCVTGQHRAILDQILQAFGVVPDFDLDIMQTGQTLAGITVARLMASAKFWKKKSRIWFWCKGIPTPSRRAL